MTRLQRPIRSEKGMAYAAISKVTPMDKATDDR
jgi:hypothetical protein